MFFEVAQQKAMHVKDSPCAFGNCVCAIRVLHKIHGLIELDQAIEQKFRACVVDGLNFTSCVVRMLRCEG